ncbi:hypothetical protein UPYG_G00041890 [Umbra pygmaea]|uniref:Uncharacterized protein n=1 Tax=Umbra pygmaea TaxID=75934 RepID=A0ABD0XRW2_UMBPY
MVRSITTQICQLSTIEELRDSSFGRPLPRHGLMLLFWYARDCVDFDFYDNMQVQCYPETGDFGFHHFGNFENILPVLLQNSREKYFEVGNLNTESYPLAKDLPPYVRQNYGLSLGHRQCNKDRIIISLKHRHVTATYVTEHKENGIQGKFDPERTHLVSPDLIRVIRHPKLELTTFLYQMGYMGLTLTELLRISLKVFIFLVSFKVGCFYHC